LSGRGSFGSLGVAGLEMGGAGRGLPGMFVFEPKESTKEGGSKSAIAIGSKGRSGTWKDGRLVGYVPSLLAKDRLGDISLPLTTAKHSRNSTNSKETH